MCKNVPQRVQQLTNCRRHLRRSGSSWRAGCGHRVLAAWRPHIVLAAARRRAGWAAADAAAAAGAAAAGADAAAGVAHLVAVQRLLLLLFLRLGQQIALAFLILQVLGRPQKRLYR